MGLKKSIKQIDGVTTDYHRILDINSSINVYTSIKVASYVDSQARLDEKNGKIISPYQNITVYDMNYIENITVEEAYEYLKTTDKFKGATDI